MLILCLIIILFLPLSLIIFNRVNKNNKLKDILIWKNGRKKGKFLYEKGGLKPLEDLIYNNELLSIAIKTTEFIKDNKYKEDLINELLVETSGIKHFYLQKIRGFEDYPTPKTFSTVRIIYNEDIKKIKNKNKEIEIIYLDYKKTNILEESCEDFAADISRISLLDKDLGKNLKNK